MTHSVASRSIIGVAVLVFALQALSLWQLRSHPYSGYRTDAQRVVVEVSPGSPADRVGLLAGDRVSVPGVSERRPRPGETERLVVDRGGRTIALELTFDPLPPADIAAYLVSSLTGVLFLVSGTWALLQFPGPTTKVLAAAGVGLAAAFVDMPYFESPVVRAVQDAVLAPVAMFGFVCLLHFTLVFPTPERVMRRRFALAILYGLPACVALTYVVVSPTDGDAKAGALASSLVVAMLAFVLSVGALGHTFLTTPSDMRSAWGLNALLASLVLGLAPMIPGTVHLLAPRVVLPMADYYDIVWVLIPPALARAAVRQARLAESAPVTESRAVT